MPDTKTVGLTENTNPAEDVVIPAMSAAGNADYRIPISMWTGRISAAVATEAAARSAADSSEASVRAAADALLIPLTQKGAANGVATLDSGGLIPSAQIPAIALSEFLGTVASEAAMLALSGQRGDWCVRTDFDPDRVFILESDDPTQAANWTDVTTPGSVISVNGQSGVVSLAVGDISGAAVDTAVVHDTGDETIDGTKTFLDEILGVSIKLDGKTGADGSGVVIGGSTVSGAPASGTHVLNELVLDESTGRLLRCVTPGSPGVFEDVYGELATTAINDHNTDPGAHPLAFDAFAETLLQQSPDLLHDFFYEYDDFLSNNITSGQIGKLGWDLTLVGTAAITAPAADLGAPGFFSLNVPATGDNAKINLNQFLFIGSPVYEVEFRHRQNSANTAAEARFGMLPDNVFAVGDGCWFQSGSTNWTFKCRNASGTLLSDDTGVAVDTTWNTFRIVSDGGSSLTGYINGVQVGQHTTEISTAGILSPRYGASRTSGSGTYQHRLDYVWFKVAYSRGDE